MGKQETFARVTAAFAPKRDDPQLVGRALIELRIGRLRLAKAEAELQWAQCCLAEGTMNVAGALAVMDDAMDDLAGAKL